MKWKKLFTAHKIFRVLKSPYFWISVGGLLWIMWLDTYDIFTQARLKTQISALENQVAQYDSAIQATQKLLRQLQTDPYVQEKWARQQHFFHKDGETIFLVDSLDSDP